MTNSLYDSPGRVASREAASRDSRLYRAAFRDARRRGDYMGQLKVAQMADAAGMPVGRTAHAEEIRGQGDANYERDSAIAGTDPNAGGGGLAGFDNRHSNQGGPGVGDYRRQRDRFMAAQAVPGAAITPMRQGDSGPAPLASQVNGTGNILPPPVLPNGAAQPNPVNPLAPTVKENLEFRTERRLFREGRPLTSPPPAAPPSSAAPSADPAVTTYQGAPVDPAVSTYAGTPAPTAPTAPRTYETAARMRERFQREMAPARQASADAAAKVAAQKPSDYERQFQGADGSIDMAKVEAYRNERVAGFTSRTQEVKRQNQVSLMAQKLVGMTRGEAQKYMSEHPEYETPEVQKEYDRIRNLLPEDEKKSTWELTGMTERLKRRAESMGVPNQFLR